MTYKRYFRNFMIDPGFQLEFTALLVVIILSFSAVLGWFTHSHLEHIQDLLLETAEVSHTTAAIIRENFNQFFFGMIALLAILSAAMTGVIFVVTHRIAGANYAIIKYVKESMMKGDFDKELVLRKKDYLKDLAYELNNLAKSLAKRPG